MQSQLVVGDSLNILNTYADYLPADGWVLKTRFTPRLSSSAAIILTAVAEGDNYRTTADSTTTAGWTAGDYSVAQWVEKAGERVTLATGEMKLLPNPATLAAGTDTRSHLEKTVAAIEAMLEGKATKDVQEYTIGDRQLKHIPLNELLVWRDKYKHQLASERASAKASQTFGRKIYSRF